MEISYPSFLQAFALQSGREPVIVFCGAVIGSRPVLVNLVSQPCIHWMCDANDNEAEGLIQGFGFELFNI